MRTVKNIENKVAKMSVAQMRKVVKYDRRKKR